MNSITFDNIFTLSHKIFENELYMHFHYSEMLLRYDSNFIEFKAVPSVDEFKETAQFLRSFHQQRGQKHVKFCFPENTKPTSELINYLKESGYDVGYMELYAVNPQDFINVTDHEDIKVVAVTKENFEVFQKLQYQQDLEFGEDFAKQKIDLHKQNLESSNILQVMAYYKDEAAGSLDVIITDVTAEIDGFNVLDNMQRKGIGSRLQKYVMDKFSDRTIILVADGEDTPREMYQKQGYKYLGFKYEAQKIYKD